MQASTQMKATGGRDASRERRAQLVQGKAALPPAGERMRTGERSAATISVAAPGAGALPAANDTPATPAASAADSGASGRQVSKARRAGLVQGKAGLGQAAATPAWPAPAVAAAAAPSASPGAPRSGREVSKARRAGLVQGKAGLGQGEAPSSASAGGLSGREMSKARRAGLVQGKGDLQQPVAVPSPTAPLAPSVANDAVPAAPPIQGSGRAVAQAMRAARARNGRGSAPETRPSGRVRAPTPLQYPPKVASSETYAGGKVTGARIGRGMNMTGDERGADVQVTGSQYIGRESGFNPRQGGVKVGAARTAAGLVVTGTQVRSKVMITGDESNSAIRVTGEADQDVGDDLLDRSEQGGYSSMQFQRQHNPHGHTVFGTNLGRSAKAVGSRERDRERAIEMTEAGLQISGTALGRSARVTGDESGSCRPVTGDQYLMPAARQPLCQTPGVMGAAPAPAHGGEDRPDPVTGEKVTVSETWARQRITGVDVEHNPRVSGDEYGVCSSVTGTPYAGPGQYDSFCAADQADAAGQRMSPGQTTGVRVTGNTPLNVQHVTGTQRGGERGITGTPYFREEIEPEAEADPISRIDSRFSVSSPQRAAQLHADASAAQAPSAMARITGSFAVGEGKITGNQEFSFNPRGGVRPEQGRLRVTGEGRVEGPSITGSAWSEQPNVTGTEGYIAAERNPSERGGTPHGFASSTLFRDKGKHEAARQIVTGMVGWSAKSAAKVTLSGGAQG